MAVAIAEILKGIPKKPRVKILDWPPLPEGATVQKNGSYLRIAGATDHPLCSKSGTMPYHRFVLYESLGRPDHSKCTHCGFLLPWRTTISPVAFHAVCADHVDANKENNSIENLVPSCWWCNANRSWAESYPEFWANWRKWLADIPPAVRPDIRKFAADFGIVIDSE